MLERKNLQKFWKISEFADTDGAVGGAFCYATNRLPARHQYRLQIAEGVVKLLESYQYLDRF